MAFQPGFAGIAALIADPAREAILVALADGRALPAGELAAVAGVSAQSASRHLQKMVEGGVLTVWSQGRFRYYRIADSSVMTAIESLCVLAQRPTKSKPSRKPPEELRFARRCYDHLAGVLGVALTSMLTARGFIALGPGQQEARFTDAGIAWLNRVGLCQGLPDTGLKLCMDWSERRPHLSGPGARHLLRDLLDKKLLRRGSAEETRALALTPEGRRWFAANGVIDADETPVLRAVNARTR